MIRKLKATDPKNNKVLKQKLSLDETLFLQTVNSLFKGLPSSVFATIIIAALVISVLWQVIDTTLLTIWFIAITSINLARFTLYKFYSQSEKEINKIFFWDRAYFILLLLNGLGFSCLSIWLSPDATSVYHYFPAMILIGISAGAVATLSFRMKNIIAYFILFLVPLFITEVLIGTFFSYSVATLTVLLVVFSLANAKRFNQTVIENIILHYNAKEHHQELIESRYAAIEASSTKTNFISMVSHELRTPLNAMLGYSQLLKMSDSPKLNEEQDEQTQGIIDSGKHLLSLIEELLDLPMIESHKLKVELEDVSLVDVLNESIRLLNPVASQYQIEIENNIENVYLVKADPKRLKQIFINLISNAIKYNHEHGKVTIDIKETSASRIIISVADTGNGLNEEQIQGLFQPFKRYSSKIEGIGLGLYITQNLVELMDGEIGVESETDKGSVFWFSLKLIEKM